MTISQGPPRSHLAILSGPRNRQHAQAYAPNKISQGGRPGDRGLNSAPALPLLRFIKGAHRPNVQARSAT